MTDAKFAIVEDLFSLKPCRLASNVGVKKIELKVSISTLSTTSIISSVGGMSMAISTANVLVYSKFSNRTDGAH